MKFIIPIFQFLNKKLMCSFFEKGDAVTFNIEQRFEGLCLSRKHSNASLHKTQILQKIYTKEIESDGYINRAWENEKKHEKIITLILAFFLDLKWHHMCVCRLLLSRWISFENLTWHLCDLFSILFSKNWRVIFQGCQKLSKIRNMKIVFFSKSK